MHAVIEAAGRQYRVEVGETVKMEKIARDPGAEVVFDKVLILATDAGTQIGKPYVADARVTGTIVRTARDRKVRVFTYKNKTTHKKLIGHRQTSTYVKITEIG
ncbi:MAG: 50S ribosomal protein L21 [Candidatus Cryosericum sp.]